jgi:hypothetical protein
MTKIQRRSNGWLRRGLRCGTGNRHEHCIELRPGSARREWTGRPGCVADVRSLRQLHLHLDADPPHLASRDVDLSAVRDTLAALEQLPDAWSGFRKPLPQRAHSTLPHLEMSVRKTLDPIEAYNMVPGRDPPTVQNPTVTDRYPTLDRFEACPVFFETVRMSSWCRSVDACHHSTA